MCAVFGIEGHPEAVKLTTMGLHSLQHRGQEGCGIVNGNFQVVKKKGHVSNLLNCEGLDKSNSAIGHNRYSTSGSKTDNLQPIYGHNKRHGKFCLAHNGNLTNTDELISKLENSVFRADSDTEILFHLIASQKSDFVDAIKDSVLSCSGSYSILAMNSDYFIAARDPYGFRPLSLGIIDGHFVVSSETCAFDLISAQYVRDIEPGEMILIDRKTENIKSISIGKKDNTKCIFELVYFARPDSVVFGITPYEFRKKCGISLAKEHPATVDYIVPVPDSGIPSALGFAEQSKIPFEMGLIRSHYASRSFIEPTQKERDLKVKMKLNCVSSVVKGKKIALVDDSLVRGTTMKRIVSLVRSEGASEIHVRIASPRIIDGCNFGIDMHKDSLIAPRMNVSELTKFLNCDSLGFLNKESMLNVTGKDYCHTCFE